MAITGTPFFFPSLILLGHFSVKESCIILCNSSSSSFLVLSSSSCARVESSIANRSSESGLEVEPGLEGVVSLRSTKTPSDPDLWYCDRKRLFKKTHTRTDRELSERSPTHTSLLLKRSVCQMFHMHSFDQKYKWNKSIKKKLIFCFNTV